jgi:hypothetical protein
MDIKKQLVLEVSLGTQKLKSEIAGLKKDLESVGRGVTGAPGTQATKKSGVAADLEKAKQINLAYRQRQKEQDQTEKAFAQRQKEVTREQEKATRELSKMAARKQEEAKKEEQRIQKTTEKEIKQNETLIEKEQAQKIKAEQKEAKRVESQKQKEEQQKVRREQQESKRAEVKQQREQAQKLKIEQKEIQRQEAQRQKDLNSEKKSIAERFEFLKKKHLEDQVRKSQLDRSVTARIARTMGVSDDKARALAESVGGMGGRGGGLLRMLGRTGGLMAAGGAMMGAANAFEDYKMLQASRRHESTSNLLGGQFVSQYSRDSGRQFSMSHVGAAAGGAVMGAGAGALTGAALGSIIPGLGTAVGALIGGLGGAIYKGIDSYMGMSEKRAARFQKETQPLQDATNAAMALNGQRLDMIKRGGSSALLNLNEAQAAAMGFSPGEAAQQYGTLQDMLGNEGAASSINTARRINLNTGASVGDTGQMIQSLTGANRQAYGVNAMGTEMVISRAMANGLDRSKTSKFLQETSSVLQGSTLYAKTNTGTITDRFTSLASAFGEGRIDDTSMQQAKTAMDQQYQASFGKGGLGGLGNILNLQDTSKKYGINLGGLDFGNLSRLSQNATVEDAMKAVSPELAANPKAKEFLSELIQNKAQNSQKAQELLGTPTALLMSQSSGLPTEQNLAFLEKTKAGTLKAGVDMTNQEVAGSQEQGMAVRNAQLAKAEVDLGRTTFKTAIENTAKDLDRLKTAFSDAVKVFNEVLKDMNMQQIQNPTYSGSGRSKGQ